jgi:hypothetical protein
MEEEDGYRFVGRQMREFPSYALSLPLKSSAVSDSSYEI